MEIYIKYLNPETERIVRYILLKLIIKPLDKIFFKLKKACFLLSIIFDTSGFYGSYTLI